MPILGRAAPHTRRHVVGRVRPLVGRGTAGRRVTWPWKKSRAGMKSSSSMYGADPLWSDSEDGDCEGSIDSVNWKSRADSRSHTQDSLATGFKNPDDTLSTDSFDDDSEDDAMFVALVSAIVSSPALAGLEGNTFVELSANHPVEMDPDESSHEFRERKEDGTGHESPVSCSDDSTWSSDSEYSSDSESPVRVPKSKRSATPSTRVYAAAATAPTREKARSRAFVPPAVPDLSATRPSPGGGRWGPPPRRKPSVSPVNAPAMPPNVPFTVRAAVARAVAKSLETKAARAEMALWRDESDSKAVIACVDDLERKAELARGQAIAWELSAALERAQNSGAFEESPESEIANSRVRRSPKFGFGKAKRVTLFGELERDDVGAAVSQIPVTKPRTQLKLAAKQSGGWRKPVTKRTARAENNRKAGSGAETSEAAENWWDQPFGSVFNTKPLRWTDGKKTQSATGVSRTRGTDTQTPSDKTTPQALRKSVDAMRWKSSGSRGVAKWHLPAAKQKQIRKPTHRDDVDAMSDDSAEWWDSGRAGSSRLKALRRIRRRKYLRSTNASSKDPTAPRVAGSAWSSPAKSTSRKDSGSETKQSTETVTPAIPSDAVTRRRVPSVAFRPLRSCVTQRRKTQSKSSATFFTKASRSRLASTAARLLETFTKFGLPNFQIDDNDASTPGPGAYDVDVSATRPSVRGPIFVESVGVTIRVSTKQDKVHTSDESFLDLSSEKHKVASGVKNTFPFVDFARCQPRVTYLAELVDKAAELEWNPTSGELLTRHVAKRKVARYEFGDDDFVDALTLKIARGEIVAPNEASRSLAEPRVKGGSWSTGLKDLSEQRQGEDDSLEKIHADYEYTTFDPRKNKVVTHSFGVAPDKNLIREKETDEAIARGPSLTHGAPDTLAQGRAAGGGVLPLRYYLSRDEDYAGAVAKREARERAQTTETFENNTFGVGGAPVVASLKVAEAIDALRRATPGTVFGLAAERWAARDGKERDAKAERQRRIAKNEQPYLAGRAARLLDDFDDETPVEHTARLSKLKEASLNLTGGAAWLGQEALKLVTDATRPSAPGWTMLPLEVTTARIAAGRNVKPGDRPGLDVKINLVRTKGFLEGNGAARFGKGAGRGGNLPGASKSETNPRVGPASYQTMKSESSSVKQKGPSAVFGTAKRLSFGSDEKDKEDAARSSSVKKRSDELVRLSLDRATRRNKGFTVDMRREFNPRVDTAVLKAQTDLRKAKALVKLDKMQGSHAKPFTKVADPYAALDAHTPNADFASLTWRVRENSAGTVTLALLEAEIGPGRYDATDDGLAGKKRTPVVDFTRATERFPEMKEEKVGVETETARSLYARSADVRAASFATRPRAAVGGTMATAKRPVGAPSVIKESDELDLPDVVPHSQVVNLADALRYLRSARHESALDFGKQEGRDGKEDTVEDLRLFGDVSARQYAAAAGAKGTDRFSGTKPSFGAPPKDFGDVDDSYLEGDVLYLTPENADDATRKRIYQQFEFAKTSGRELAGGPVPVADPELTRDIDFVSERVLQKRFPRLDKGSNAVDIGAARVARGGLANDQDGDGVYHDSRGDAFVSISGRRRAPVAEFSMTHRDSIGGHGSTGVGGDSLVLRPEIGVDYSKPRKHASSVSFAKAPARRDEGERALPYGDGLLLEPVYPATGGADSASRQKAHDFGRAAGRANGSNLNSARWSQATVIQALRAELPISENTLDRTAFAKDGYAVAAARQMERRARLEARMARRGLGEDAPSLERRDGPIR